MGPPLAFLLVAFAWPLAHVLQAAITGILDPAGPARAAWTWAGTEYVQSRIRIAVWQAILSVALTLALAFPLAWLHHRYRVPGRRVHLALHAAPFVLPVFVVVYGIQGIFGARGWLHHWTGIDLLATLGPLGAVVIAHAYYNYGLAARLITTILDRRPHRLEEAAATLGASPREAFWRISAPQLVAATVSVALLVFVFAFTSFGVILFLGGTEVSTLETLIYRNLVTAFPNEARAAVIGIGQLAVNALVLGAYLMLVKRGPRPEAERQRARNPAPAHIHVVATLALIAGLAPACAVLVGGFRLRGAWSLEPWRALTDPTHPAHLVGFDVLQALSLSILYALGTVLLAIALTLLFAYGVRTLHPTARRGSELFGAIPLGTSSVLVGLGFLLAFGADDHFDLRGTRTLILLAHTLIAFPFVARVLLPALDHQDPRQDEAAALLGATPFDTFRRVHLPQLKAPIAVAAGFAAALSLGDFGASLLLMRTDNMSLAVWIGRHDRPFDPLMKAQAVALSGLLMLLAASAYVLVERFRDTHRSDL